MNLRTGVRWISKRADLEPWPKLWQNLRSARETELADQFPAHVASAWIGNSVAVAVEYYLQVTEDHFKQAAKKATQNTTHRLHQTEDITPELQRVIEAWPSLPTTIRRGIMAMVEEMRRVK